MKILAIRLKNLTSIEGTVEVDFTAEPLCSAGIFAISGPTGAGKSTLLDALCLALYDKAPRFAASVESVNLADVGDNRINQSDVRNLLRRGTSDGYAEVDFLGVDGHRYRSCWSVRRTRNKVSGSLQPQMMEVKELDTGKEFQGTKKELLAQLVELIGLTYEQFTRTVLLAQNDFATFLKSKGAAKAELLEKLTGTGVYSFISQEVFARNKAAQEEVALIHNKMSVIELIPEEEQLALQKEKELLAEKRSEGIKLLAEQNAQLNVVRSLKTQEELRTKKQKEEQGEQARLKTALDILASQEEGLVRFKAQWEAIQPDLKRARQLDVQIQSQQEGYIQSQQLLQAARKQVQEQDKRKRMVEEQLHLSYQTLRRLLNVAGTEDSLRLEQVEETLRQEEGNLSAGIETNEKRLERLNAFGYPSLAEEQVKLQKELARQQNIRQLTEALKKAMSEIEHLEKEAADCSKELSEREVALKTVQRLYENARMAVGKDVKALRRQLEEGEACPVCGSTSHPYHREQEVVDTLFRNMEQEYNAATAVYQQVNNRSIALQRDLAHQKMIAGQVREQLSAFQKESTDTGNEEQIQQRLGELAKLILEYRNLYAEWQRGDEEIKKLRSHYEALRENVSRCRLAMQKVSAANEQSVLLQNAAIAEQKRFEVIEKALDTLRRERSGLLKGKSADEAEAAVARREGELNLALEKARKEVETAQNGLSGLQGELKQIASSIEELQVRQKQIEFPEQLPEAIKKQQEENLNTERSLSIIEARLLQQAKNKAAVEQIAKELSEKQSVADRWAKLNKLIGSADGAKFKVIAQSYTLNLLLLHANKHLSYLSKRYKLQQVPGTLALQVVDCDMCDEIRTVYSLSGGESFLISLALALGLSSLSSNNLKVESLFIDEGFGSLDAESLRTAMEALEQLQMQGRKIGVISHVQEMSERISVQVQVHKKVNGKSVLSVVG
ncbi:AAA family ATPase [Bacteroides finegoldii]|jgi:exonuclease SbcCD, C subunit|uniref:AAA family ATPase n=1 Tax=Bacteroides finegoldii TaxID=338188 RepID=A0A7J4YSY6_9BACE|nr:AAA family ATPase [Bacteroides finegoldii]EEX45201.1 exonuclease SbcCD, C subunit [Bacteroides finegoldii DSM 17565]KAA5219842.1 AAA family ATPase [Bacteroides finegoldii]KAA5223719.1 AAA family ATPase [Bacteroides finegoldii]KAA5226066.1 AAA family ATPase [Bacteroides finegoldii]KAA5231908.1 AAA family ATPase [Bacteroides finegoldii]